MEDRIGDNLLKLLPYEVQVEIEENIRRKDLAQSELGAIQKLLKEEFAKHTQQGKRTDLTSVSNNTQVKIGRVKGTDAIRVKIYSKPRC